MKRRKFKVNLVGSKNESVEITSTDYDVANGFVRYKDVVYDIRTGLWVCILERLKCGIIGNNLKIIEPNAKLTMSNMIETLIHNDVAMGRINERREICKDLPTMNELPEERTLFS